MKTADILIYHGKHGTLYWLVDTPGRLCKAFMALFNVLDTLGCYEDLEEHEMRWAKEARVGSGHCARKLLDAHNGAEYECWEIESAEIEE